MSLVLERARQLAKALGECDEYVSYKKSLEELEKHEAARIMWTDFQHRQAEIQRARLSGEEIPEERISELERSYEILMMNPYIRDVIAAEFRFTHLFADVQRIIGEAVGIRYADPRDTETEETDAAPGSGAAGAGPASSDDAGAGSSASDAAGASSPNADAASPDEAQSGAAGSGTESDDDDLKGPRRIIVPGRDI